MEIFGKVSDTFWSHNFWLPPNTTWEDMTPEANPDVQYTDYRDLIWPIPLAAFVIVLRYCVDRFWLRSMARFVGIKGGRPKKPENIPALAQAYAQTNQLDRRKIVALTKQLDMTERQIERWWRLRKAQDKPTTMTKFCESGWKCLYYCCSFTAGLLILWDKPWLWDFKSCWYGYPHQSYTNGIWWYYMISMSFYWSLTVTQFFDVKRKDFWQMFIHHLVTLLLMALSWISNLHRVGSLVLVIHDCADILLEAAKMVNYAKYQKICDTLFGIFTVTWLITRLGFYPRLIYSSSFEYPAMMPLFPAYCILNGLLVILLLLHMVWTYMIFKILIDSLQKGFMTGDVRSSDSEVSDSSVQNHQTHVQNNNNNNYNKNGITKRNVPIKKQ